MATLKVTDEEKYNNNLDSLDIDSLEFRGNSFHGSIEITMTNSFYETLNEENKKGLSKVYSGEFGARDFEEDFGFVIIED